MGQVLGATSHQFQLYYNDALGASVGQGVCNAMAETVYVDYEILSSWFGGIQVDSFDLHVDPAGTNSAAEHFDCGARDIHFDKSGSFDFDRMLAQSEVVEVFEANFDGDWDCGNSLGEGLSRVLAEALYPGNATQGSKGTPARVWLDITQSNGKERQNWVQTNDETDQDYDSIGCAALFLNWLRYQLGYRWDDIVQAARQVTDLTAEHLYHQLTGGGPWSSPGSGIAWKTFRNFVDSKFPPGTATNLSSNNPFPFTGNEQWSDWENRGQPPGGLHPSMAPAVASRLVNWLDIVVTGTDNAVWILNWNGSSWQPWKSVGGTVTAAPTAIAVERAGFHIYARATDDTMYHFQDYVQPTPLLPVPWLALGGGSVQSAAAAASWAPYRVDLFAANNGMLVHRYSQDHGVTFTNWESLGQPNSSVHLQGAPAAVSRGPRLLDVAVRGSDGNLWQIQWDGINWQPWKQLATPAIAGHKDVSDPALTTWWLPPPQQVLPSKPQRLDLFVVDSTGSLYQKISMDGGESWQNGAPLGTPPTTTLSSGPAAVSWGPNRIDIFAVGKDQNLWHRWWG
jgi:hypothetical protein